ncbi:ENTH domain-containing protein C794.11c isoform X2 [Lotus japonicus]|nr:ENTH domain-containing protein C794.11c isoform X2 [Lotus japonicus]
MTRIAEASFDIDEYWRIVDILHRRLYSIDWEQWRQSYKALVLLEFMLTHGPEEFAREFQCYTGIIEELGSFTHIDDKGFNWGSRMQNLSDQILKLLQSGEALKEARLKALKITNEIQGFGSSLNSPSSSTSPTSLFSEASPGSSSFSSFSTSSTPASYICSSDHHKNVVSPSNNVKHVDENHLWDGPGSEEKNVLVDSDEDAGEVGKPKGFVSEMCSKIIGSGKMGSREKIEFRCISDVGSKVTKKRFDRQYSLWF